jgi:hypothetical protein
MADPLILGGFFCRHFDEGEISQPSKRIEHKKTTPFRHLDAGEIPRPSKSIEHKKTTPLRHFDAGEIPRPSKSIEHKKTTLRLSTPGEIPGIFNILQKSLKTSDSVLTN